MKKLVFTGTRKGMTDEQKKTVAELLRNFVGVEAHHGGCHGADGDFHELVTKAGFPIVVHPGDEEQRSRYAYQGCSVVSVKPYLIRNREMVDLADMVVACPGGPLRELRSGTWATIRYAEKSRKSLVVVWPNGAI